MNQRVDSEEELNFAQAINVTRQSEEGSETSSSLIYLEIQSAPSSIHYRSLTPFASSEEISLFNEMPRGRRRANEGDSRHESSSDSEGPIMMRVSRAQPYYQAPQAQPQPVGLPLPSNVAHSTRASAGPSIARPTPSRTLENDAANAGRRFVRPTPSSAMGENVAVIPPRASRDATDVGGERRPTPVPPRRRRERSLPADLRFRRRPTSSEYTGGEQLVQQMPAEDVERGLITRIEGETSMRSALYNALSSSINLESHRVYGAAVNSQMREINSLRAIVLENERLIKHQNAVIAHQNERIEEAEKKDRRKAADEFLEARIDRSVKRNSSMTIWTCLAFSLLIVGGVSAIAYYVPWKTVLADDCAQQGQNNCTLPANATAVNATAARPPWERGNDGNAHAVMASPARNVAVEEWIGKMEKVWNKFIAIMSHTTYINSIDFIPQEFERLESTFKDDSKERKEEILLEVRDVMADFQILINQHFRHLLKWMPPEWIEENKIEVETKCKCDEESKDALFETPGVHNERESSTRAPTSPTTVVNEHSRRPNVLVEGQHGASGSRQNILPQHQTVVNGDNTIEGLKEGNAREGEEGKEEGEGEEERERRDEIVKEREEGDGGDGTGEGETYGEEKKIEGVSDLGVENEKERKNETENEDYLEYSSDYAYF